MSHSMPLAPRWENTVTPWAVWILHFSFCPWGSARALKLLIWEWCWRRVQNQVLAVRRCPVRPLTWRGCVEMLTVWATQCLTAPRLSSQLWNTFRRYDLVHIISGSVNIGHFQRVWIRIQWIENTFRGCVKDSVIIQRVWFFKKRFFSTGFFVLCKKFGLPYLGKVQQPQEQRYPFLSVCAVFLCTSKQWYGCQCVF